MFVLLRAQTHIKQVFVQQINFAWPLVLFFRNFAPVSARSRCLCLGSNVHDGCEEIVFRLLLRCLVQNDELAFDPPFEIGVFFLPLVDRIALLVAVVRLVESRHVVHQDVGLVQVGDHFVVWGADLFEEPLR